MMYFQKPPLGVPLDWENPLNKGLVMHLAMNEGHGDVVRDLSMYGNHGKLYVFASPPTVASGWNPGRDGIGLNFDGTNDHINCGNNPSLDITDEFTINMIINPAASTQDYHRFIHKNGSFSFNIDYTAPPNNKLWFHNYNSGTSSESDLNPITFDKLNYITMTKSSDGVFFYVDAIMVGSDVSAGAKMPLSTNDADIYIGIDEDLTSYGYKGAIDTTRSLNRALSAKEVMDYYINPNGVYLQ